MIAIFRNEPDTPKEWEKQPPIGKRLVRGLTTWFHQTFLRDVYFNKMQVFKIILRALALIAFFVIWVDVLYGKPPAAINDFDGTIQWTAAIAGAVMILLTGFITDTLIEKHGIFEKVALVTLAPMLVLLVVPDMTILAIAMVAYTVFVAFLIVFFFVGLLINTTMLNRARVIVIMFIFMAAFAIPVGGFIILVQTQFFIWIFILVLTIVSLYFTLKNPRRYTPHLATVQQATGWRGFLRVMRDSHVMRTALFLFCTSLTLGFHAITTVNAITGSGETALLVITAIASLPIIAAIIDNKGRKPIVYVMLVVVGTFSAFFDQPGFDATPFQYLKVAIYAFSVILVIVLTAVLAGDLSSSISRGRITSLLLFCLILGAVFGVMAGNWHESWILDHGSPNALFTTTISNITSFAIFMAMFLFLMMREPFQPGTTSWRDYLVRLHVIMNNGLSLVFKEFKKRKVVDDIDTSYLEDLESGGLTGLQQMLQEIASSRQRIRVLDHGDVFLIFHYGNFTTAVLFVKKDLVIYREKLANFHLQFESINKEVIKENYINQEEIQHVNWLIQTYFE